MNDLPRSTEFVIFGADIGTYGLARSVHEAYGVVSQVYAGAELGPIAHSRIINLTVLSDSHDEGIVVETLRRHAAESSAEHIVLLVNSDWLVRLVAQHRFELDSRYILPYPTEDVRAAVTDKARFAEICAENGISTPGTVIVSFADGVPERRSFDFPYPLIAKAATSAEWEYLDFPGKRKVYEINSPEELSLEFSRAYEAGFRGEFVIQELIRGSESQLRSVTAYVRSDGEISAMCVAQILLEEHTPSGLGNAAALITYRDDELLEQAQRFLRASQYRGFACFDIKVDPRTNEPKFLEVNPRIGRNNYYLSAAGVNPIPHVVDDLLMGRPHPQEIVHTEILYSLVPHTLLRKYVRGPLAERVNRLIKARRTVHPLAYAKDWNPRRWFYVTVAKLNQVRKFRRYYPAPSETGF